MRGGAVSRRPNRLDALSREAYRGVQGRKTCLNDENGREKKITHK